MPSQAKIREAKRKQRRINRELQRIENAGGRAAIRTSRKLYRRAQDRLKDGSKRALKTSDLTDELSETLSKSMMSATVIGQDRADQVTREAPTLQLDELSDMLAALKKRRKKRKASVFGSTIDLRKEYRKLARKSAALSIEKMSTKLINSVTDSITGNLHVREGRSELRKAMDEVGGLRPRDAILNTLFRTHSQMAYHGTAWAELDANAQTLWGYMYSTAGDERVRPEHAAMDGAILPKDHKLWQTLAPPNGWNCRCFLIPLFDPELIVRPKTGWSVDKGFAVNWGKQFLTA